jgi:hypothetical protein
MTLRADQEHDIGISPYFFPRHARGCAVTAMENWSGGNTLTL